MASWRGGRNPTWASLAMHPSAGLQRPFLSTEVDLLAELYVMMSYPPIRALSRLIEVLVPGSFYRVSLQYIVSIPRVTSWTMMAPTLLLCSSQ